MSEIITIDYELDDEFLDDVFITAVEGGINYWAIVEKEDTSGFSRITPVEEDDWEEFRINQRDIAIGIEKILTHDDWKGRSLTKRLVKFDAGDLDVNDADAIIQMALFDEVVYG